MLEVTESGVRWSRRGGTSKQGSFRLPGMMQPWRRQYILFIISTRNASFRPRSATQLHSIIVFGLIGIGLAVCAFGAIAFDIVRVFGSW